MNNYAFGCDAIAVALTATQTNEVLAIIQAVCTIVFLIAGFVLKFIDWYKKSKADGKIDKEEIKEIAKEAIKTGEEIAKEVKQVSDKDQK